MTALQRWTLGALLALGAGSAAICAGLMIGLGSQGVGIGFACVSGAILLGALVVEAQKP